VDVARPPGLAERWRHSALVCGLSGVSCPNLSCVRATVLVEKGWKVSLALFAVERAFLDQYPWVPEVVAGTAGVVVTLFITWLWRQSDKDTKTFDYRVISDIPIFFERERPEDLKVTYKNVDVSDPRVTQIRFKNTGKRAIEATDFEEPYRIERGSAGILDFAVIESSTQATELATIVELGAGTPEYIAIQPKTLNSGDWFTVQIIFDAVEETVSVIGRVTDESRPTALYPSRTELAAANEYRGAGYVFGAFPVFLAIPMYLTVEPRNLFAALGMAAFGVLIMVGGQLISFRKRRQLFAKLRAGTQRPDPD
jgi:hypothetical protein